MINPIVRAVRGTLVLPCIALLGILSVPAEGKVEPRPAAPELVCQIRYHFREHLEGVKPGGKNVSAAADEREALPSARVVLSDGQRVLLVEGRVTHLPYRFAIKWTRSGDPNAGTLEVNILDTAGKPLRGYPQTVKNPFKAANPGSQEFEIPIAKELAQTIEKALLARNQFVTHVDLSIEFSP
jgi:hypothetical protein